MPDVETTDIPTPAASPAPAPQVVTKAPAQPVRVDNSNRRSTDDVLEGHFGYVVSGEHAGRYGVFEDVAERADDGYPKSILFRTRDDRGEYLTVDYADVRPDRAGKR